MSRVIASASRWPVGRDDRGFASWCYDNAMSDSRVAGEKHLVTCEGKAIRAGLLLMLLSVPLGCASRNPALEYVRQRRFADNSEFRFELRSVYYDERVAMSE